MDIQQLQQNKNMALTARTLGALFCHSPSDKLMSPLVAFLQTEVWCDDWPYGSQEQRQYCAELMMRATEEPLHIAWQRLFIGPNELPAPPWGSVYLDRESVLFGESTLALRRWMLKYQICGQTEGREPEDHFGLLLLLIAWLAELQPQQMTELLAEHILPWSSRYLTLMIQKAEHPFYQGIAELALLTLNAWRVQLDLTPAEPELYF
ncbi:MULTISPECIES: Tat proofreading chaperone DmsD [unclassified Serratia (in: enterobacteria)]|uniref:Tat proofreading chaperone DmsD n=1 Tax=unclassified Serratia (in: enterobacteria) TaxID=2647522 RepID=UPI0027F51121|nr:MULTISPECIES: Tat proofreading chaperone DmsD [unclassified Serratia (in: enterobacteria)]MDQ7098768.1 Tat proofreading chaperone DmsD [Serratia sp. MF2]MDQ7102387.1 Tat proofreading chaperone DmsD [Serratia sp. MF1(2023)]